MDVDGITALQRDTPFQVTPQSSPTHDILKQQMEDSTLTDA